MPKEKVIVVMPAYNAERTLRKTVGDIPSGSVDEIILVDDFSSDRTAQVAQELGLTVVRHPRNLGYGANQKTCYRLALEKGADYIIMIHPDYQYDCRLIPTAVGILKLGICDILLGNRVRTRRECLASGMPFYKYFANRFLTILENIILGQNMGEFHSGFRAYRREVLEKIPYRNNDDGFVFDTQLLAQGVYFGFLLGDIPIPVRYLEESSSIGFKSSVAYGLKTLWIMALFCLQKMKLAHSPIFNRKES